MSAAELERLTPAEQDAAFQASIVRDLSLVRPGFLARIRQRAAEHVKASEAGSGSSSPPAYNARLKPSQD